MYQRQLSKEGLQSLVSSSSKAVEGGGAAGTNAMSSEELRDLFTLQTDTLSDTYASMWALFASEKYLLRKVFLLGSFSFQPSFAFG